MDFSQVVKMADTECTSCASPSRSLVLTLSLLQALVIVNTSLLDASSSLGHLRSPPRKKGKSMGQESPSLVGVFDVVLKNTEIGYKNTEIRLRAY